ncbi:MAG: MBL fold metallo-hydrolase [Halieaceae bacterium]
MLPTRLHTYCLVLVFCTLASACSNKTPEADSPTPAASETAAASSAADTSADSSADSSAMASRGNEAEADPSNWWSALPRAAWASYEKIETQNPWFEVYRIMDGIYAIYEPGQFEEVISFLIVGKSQALLFDTGLGMDNILSVVKGLTKKRITVLNSHGHYDHIGGNYQFDNIIGRNTAFTQARAKGIAHDKVAEFASEDWIWKQHPPNFLPGSYHIKPYEFSRWIEEGQFIDLGEVSLEVVFAPGHAPDGIVLIDHQRRLMFTGDTFYPAPLYAHLEGSSFDDYAATANKLAAMVGAVDTLLTSHNVPTASSDKLRQLNAAFQSIIAGIAPFEMTDDGREYRFDGFSILTHDPPQDEVDVFKPL